jgi:hypothetical protein
MDGLNGVSVHDDTKPNDRLVAAQGRVQGPSLERDVPASLGMNFRQRQTTIRHERSLPATGAATEPRPSQL